MQNYFNQKPSRHRKGGKFTHVNLGQGNLPELRKQHRTKIEAQEKNLAQFQSMRKTEQYNLDQVLTKQHAHNEKLHKLEDIPYYIAKESDERRARNLKADYDILMNEAAREQKMWENISPTLAKAAGDLYMSSKILADDLYAKKAIKKLRDKNPNYVAAVLEEALKNAVGFANEVTERFPGYASNPEVLQTLKSYLNRNSPALNKLLLDDFHANRDLLYRGLALSEERQGRLLTSKNFPGLIAKRETELFNQLGITADSQLGVLLSDMFGKYNTKYLEGLLRQERAQEDAATYKQQIAQATSNPALFASVAAFRQQMYFWLKNNQVSSPVGRTDYNLAQAMADVIVDSKLYTLNKYSGKDGKRKLKDDLLTVKNVKTKDSKGFENKFYFEGREDELNYILSLHDQYWQKRAEQTEELSHQEDANLKAHIANNTLPIGDNNEAVTIDLNDPEHRDMLLQIVLDRTTPNASQAAWEKIGNTGKYEDSIQEYTLIQQALDTANYQKALSLYNEHKTDGNKHELHRAFPFFKALEEKGFGDIDGAIASLKATAIVDKSYIAKDWVSKQVGNQVIQTRAVHHPSVARNKQRENQYINYLIARYYDPNNDNWYTQVEDAFRDEVAKGVPTNNGKTNGTGLFAIVAPENHSTDATLRNYKIVYAEEYSTTEETLLNIVEGTAINTTDKVSSVVGNLINTDGNLGSDYHKYLLSSGADISIIAANNKIQLHLGSDRTKTLKLTSQAQWNSDIIKFMQTGQVPKVIQLLQAIDTNSNNTLYNNVFLGQYETVPVSKLINNLSKAMGSKFIVPASHDFESRLYHQDPDVFFKTDPADMWAQSIYTNLRNSQPDLPLVDPSIWNKIIMQNPIPFEYRDDWKRRKETLKHLEEFQDYFGRDIYYDYTKSSFSTV